MGAQKIYFRLILNTKKESTAQRITHRLKKELGYLCDLKVTPNSNDLKYEGNYEARFFLYDEPQTFLGKSSILSYMWHFCASGSYRNMYGYCKYPGVAWANIEWGNIERDA